MCQTDRECCEFRRNRSRLVQADELHTINKKRKNRKSSTDETEPPETLMNQRHLTGISPAERISSMFDCSLYSDCSFLVEGQEIKAHRVILALASPKMETIFLGTDRTDKTVEVPFSLRVMQLVLKHCYLQDMDIESLDEAQDVIEAASWFDMKDLVELCCAGIEPETLDDLWPALNLACTHNSRALKESCLSVALKHSDSILSHEGFLLLSPEALSFLLSREVIDVNSEKEILEATVMWAQTRITTSEDLTLRKELEKCDIIKNIRILALPEKDFVDFLTGIGKKIFTEDELEKIEYNYFSDTCEKILNPSRMDRMLEQRIPICGYDYLSANSDINSLDVGLKIYETTNGIRPIIKTIIVPSQINPANILYDNVSHRTHYNECMLVEVIVNNTIVARGSFYDRVKYSDDVHINLNTFNHTSMYINKKVDDLGMGQKYYEATIRILFKTYGFYPLAIETKEVEAIELLEKSRFIHEIVLASPKI